MLSLRMKVHWGHVATFNNSVWFSNGAVSKGLSLNRSALFLRKIVLAKPARFVSIGVHSWFSSFFLRGYRSSSVFPKRPRLCVHWRGHSWLPGPLFAIHSQSAFFSKTPLTIFLRRLFLHTARMHPKNPAYACVGGGPPGMEAMTNM